MSVSPAEIIYQLLLDIGAGVGSGESGEWPVFISFLPDKPDNAICVYDTAGMMDGRIMLTGEKVEHPGIQIRVRGPVYLDVWRKVNSIATSLDIQRRISVAISSDQEYLVHNISRTGAVVPLGIEEIGDRRRHHFTINAVVTISNGDISFLTTEDGDYFVLD